MTTPHWLTKFEDTFKKSSLYAESFDDGGTVKEIKAFITQTLLGHEEEWRKTIQAKITLLEATYKPAHSCGYSKALQDILELIT